MSNCNRDITQNYYSVLSPLLKMGTVTDSLYCYGYFVLFQMEWIRLWISWYNVLPCAWINSSRI